MAKILCTFNTEKGALNFIAGRVEEIREPEGKRPHAIVMTVDMVNENKETVSTKLEIVSWPDNSWNRIEQIHKMKLEVGSYVLLRGGNIKENERAKSTPKPCNMPLFGINYSGTMDIDRDSHLFATLGPIKDITENDDGSALITVKVRDFDREEKKSVEKSIPVLTRRGLYNGLKKAGIKAGGSLAVAGTMDSGIMTAKSVDYCAPRPRKDKE